MEMLAKHRNSTNTCSIERFAPRPSFVQPALDRVYKKPDFGCITTVQMDKVSKGHDYESLISKPFQVPPSYLTLKQFESAFESSSRGNRKQSLVNMSGSSPRDNLMYP
jgi:hypothetical protein